MYYYIGKYIIIDHLEKVRIMSEEVSPEELLRALMEESAVSEVGTKITEVLKELSEINQTIEAAIVSSAEGLPVAWYAKSPNILKEEGRVAAAVTVIFSTSERNSMDLGKGHVEHIVVRTDEGNIILQLINEDYILAVVTSPEAKLGVVRRDMKQASKKILDIINSI